MKRTAILLIVLTTCFFTSTSISKSTKFMLSNDDYHKSEMTLYMVGNFPIPYQGQTFVRWQTVHLYYKDHHYIAEHKTKMTRYIKDEKTHKEVESPEREYLEIHLIDPASFKELVDYLFANLKKPETIAASPYVGVIGQGGYNLQFACKGKKFTISGGFVDKSEEFYNEEHELLDNVYHEVFQMLSKNNININREPYDSVYNWKE